MIGSRRESAFAVPLPRCRSKFNLRVASTVEQLYFHLFLFPLNYKVMDYWPFSSPPPSTVYPLSVALSLSASIDTAWIPLCDFLLWLIPCISEARSLIVQCLCLLTTGSGIIFLFDACIACSGKLLSTRVACWDWQPLRDRDAAWEITFIEISALRDSAL